MLMKRRGLVFYCKFFPCFSGKQLKKCAGKFFLTQFVVASLLDETANWTSSAERSRFCEGSRVQSTCVHSLCPGRSWWHSSHISFCLGYPGHRLVLGVGANHISLWNPATRHFSQTWAFADFSFVYSVWCEPVIVSKRGLITQNSPQVDNGNLQIGHYDIINTEQNYSVATFR
jgi:hypothetical protein